MKVKQKMTHRLAAMAVVAASVAGAADAEAANTSLRNVTGNIATATGGLPNMISMFAYIAGIAFAVLGIFKIKQHVDAPANVPLAQGMTRLAVGGGFLSLPFMTKVMQGSISNNDQEKIGGSALIVSNTLSDFQ